MLLNCLVNGSLQQVKELGLRIGNARRNLDTETFCDALQEIGMDAEEIASYWNYLDVVRDCGCRWVEASKNTQLATELGILLDSRYLPRNYLLYRIVALMHPALFSIQIVTVAHRGKLLNGRWELCGPGLKKVLKVR